MTVGGAAGGSAASFRLPDRIASELAAQRGWRRLALAAIAGALSVLAMPPWGVWPVLFVTFPALVFLLDGVRLEAPDLPAALRLAALIGFAFGFGYLVPGLYWVAEAFLVEPQRHAWLIPFAIGGLAALLALFIAAGTALAMALWRPSGSRIIALAIGLALADVARGVLFTGFPWNAFGYALTIHPGMMQTASLIGVYALGLIAVATFASPAALLSSGYGPARRAEGGALVVVIGALLIGATLWGNARLASAADATVDRVRLRLVQANIPQSEKWSPNNVVRAFSLYLSLTQNGGVAPTVNGLAGVTHVVWPETAVPFLISESPEALAGIAAILPDDATLLMGSVRMEEKASPGGIRRAYNSLYAIDGAGKIAGIYDKIHLVPFGEYLPFQDFMERLGVMQMTGVRGGFSAGEGPRLMQIAGAPDASPLVCYEAIFPHGVVDPGRRPGWLLNITNDAWFGASAGPYQHFHQARVRAVEQGLPLVRSANTGISAVVDPYGRIVAMLGLDRIGAVDSPLPRALPPTPFAAYGRLMELAVLLTAFLVWAAFHLAASIERTTALPQSRRNWLQTMRLVSHAPGDRTEGQRQFLRCRLPAAFPFLDLRRDWP